MTFKELRDKLLELENKYGDQILNIQVDVMQEDNIGEIGTIQLQSRLQDLAVSSGKDKLNYVVLIGNEED